MPPQQNKNANGMDIFNRPPSISEDTLHYILYPTSNLSDKISVTTLAAVMQSFVDTVLPNHLWHRDAFQLKVVPNENGQGYVLEGMMRVGDCVDDEWCAVWLLREISSQWDVAISVNDTDGEFLLIEAAEQLPSWVTPTNAENRVWIYHSRLHLIPLSHVSAPSSKPFRRPRYDTAEDSDDEDGLSTQVDEDYLSVEDALQIIRNDALDTVASPDIEHAVENKIRGYPAAARQHVHYTKVYVPADIAKALSVNDSLVQKPVETFYTRDALQLRAAHRMSRFPPEPQVLTTVKMTRTAYAQLQGQKFYPPKIFGHWQEPEGTPERRWRDTGMKLACGFEMLYQESKGRGVAANPTVDGRAAAAQARRESLQRNADYNQYLQNLQVSGYFKGEKESSALWRQLEDGAIDAFLAARRNDDAARPSFASEVNVAVSQAGDSYVSLREEDSDQWLDIDAVDFDSMLQDAMGKGSERTDVTMDVDGPHDHIQEDNVTQQQTTRLQEMAKKVEDFVERSGDLEGAKFEDDEFSDDSLSDDESGSDMESSPAMDQAERQAAMDKLVPALGPSEYGKMPPSFYSNSQRVARTTKDNGPKDESIAQDIEANSADSEFARRPSKPIRPPMIPRDEYDGVDSDDETDEEEEHIDDEDSEEERPQVVGEIEIDMEEEQEEFLEFARHALGMSDEQWASIIKERGDRGAFVPSAASTVGKETMHTKRDEIAEEHPSLQPASSSQSPGPNPTLTSFEAVMEAMDVELGRLKSVQNVAAPDKGKGKTTSTAQGDIETAMDAELQALMMSDHAEDNEEDFPPPSEHLDYNLIKNFLESYKSQSGLAGPVSNLVGRLQPGWTLPRDES